jgi:hypothetical protein
MAKAEGKRRQTQVEPGPAQSVAGPVETMARARPQLIWSRESDSAVPEVLGPGAPAYMVACPPPPAGRLIRAGARYVIT